MPDLLLPTESNEGQHDWVADEEPREYGLDPVGVTGVGTSQRQYERHHEKRSLEEAPEQE